MGKYMQNRVLKAFVVCVCLTLVAARCFVSAETCCGIILAGCVSFLSLLSCLVTWQMSKMNPADTHTWRSLLVQYALFVFLPFKGGRVYDHFLNSCKAVKKTQTSVLMKILNANQLTMYGIKHHFSNIRSPEEFVTSHPLTKYGHYCDHIQDIVEGKQNIMTKDKVIFLATSSGTTGPCKIVPVTHYLKGPAGKQVGPLMYYFMNMKGKLDLQRVFVLSYKSIVTKVLCGLKKGPVTAHMSRYMPFALSPEESFEIANEQAALHVHAVFALQEEEVGHMEALMSTLVYSFWRYVENNQASICDNIEHASLPKHIDADRDILVSLRSKLTANKHRANFLRHEFAKGFKGIALRIWPSLRFVKMLTTGGFAHYAKLLQEHYMLGIKQLSLAHVASEGFMGFNMSMKPDDCTYTAMIEYGFQEYIPLQKVDQEHPVTVFAEQVQMNNMYEIVLTTSMGLYRYRTGDIVKIVGFCHQCPIYEFQYRLGQMLNLHWEKLPETVFYDSIQQTTQLLIDDVTLVDYTATEDICLDGLYDQDNGNKETAKHYVLFIEMENGDKIHTLSNDNKEKYDDDLRSNFELYNTMRTSGSIGQMEVIQVTTGTFQHLKALMIEHTQNQAHKMPRVLRNKHHLKYLLSQDIQQFQSALK